MATTFAEVPPLTSLQPAAARFGQTPVALYPCLILTSQDHRGQMFDAAASASGWRTVICQDEHQAALQIARHRFALVIVDLEGDDADTIASFRQRMEQIAQQNNPLLMVAGDERDPLQEIWARQFGAWVYLAGVDAACDLEMVFDEARETAEKLFPWLTSRSGELV